LPAGPERPAPSDLGTRALDRLVLQSPRRSCGWTVPAGRPAWL